MVRAQARQIGEAQRRPIAGPRVLDDRRVVGETRRPELRIAGAQRGNARIAGGGDYAVGCRIDAREHRAVTSHETFHAADDTRNGVWTHGRCGDVVSWSGIAPRKGVMMRTLLGVVTLVSATALAACGSTDHRTPSHAAATSATPTPAKLAQRCATSIPGTVRTYRAADGAALEAALLGSGEVGVVIANSWTRDLCEWVVGDDRFVRSLVRGGARVLLFDYRGTGQSPAVSGAARARYDADVVGAAALLRELGARKIVVVGGSLGGIIALVAARQIRPPPAALVSLSGSGFAGTNTGADYGGLDGKAAIARLRVPVQLVVARDDDAYRDTRVLYAAAGAHDKRLLVVSGSAHSSELLRADLNLSAPKVRATVLRFIRQYTQP
jgi:pimeloyl-ACP methyl ester carboxylesterase